MMKFLLSIVFFFLSLNSFSQIPKSGTYTYKFCDIEYNSCINTCKVKISGKKIWVYAPSNLSGIKEGELLESGTLYKHKSGKWTIVSTKKESAKKAINASDLFLWIDFKKKQYWQF
jgi:hypothetical protein